MNHPSGRAVCIYVLKDPSTGAVRYVGWTISPEKRLLAHMRTARSGREKNHKANWIRSLLARGLKPALEVIEHNQINFAERERFWINHYRSNGCQLTNGTDGGEGRCGLVYTAAQRARISAALKGRKYPHRPSPPQNVRDAVAAANRRRVWTFESRQKAASGSRGRKHSPETRRKLAEIWAEIGATPEWKQHLDRVRVRKHTPETRRKMSLAKRPWLAFQMKLFPHE